MIPVNEPLLDGNELKYVTECINSGWISSEGEFVSRLEKNFAKAVGREYGIAVSNGTAALQLAVEALSLKPGDEIIIPSFTIISCASAISRLGLKPVPVDCDLATLNAEARHFESAITSRTRAIMVVHIYGLPVDMDPVIDLAKKYNLYIIEDAAEVIGQSYKGRQCGSFGDISIFSLYPNKHVTTGEGGIIFCDNPRFLERSTTLRNLAFKPPRRFIHEEFGWNYRMTNLQAAIGVAQLEQLDRNVRLKREIGRLYNENLVGLPRVTLPKVRTDYAENIYWVYSLLLDRDFPVDAVDVMSVLADAGIGTRPFFWPMHEQPILQKMYPDYANIHLPNAEYVARKGFYIPSGLGLNLNKIAEISETVRRVIEKF